MGFKNLTTYFFTCCKFNTVWQIVPQRANWCSEGYLSVYCCVAFWYRRTWMGLKIDAFPMVYTFGSDRLQTVVLMNETGSCTAIRNVQKVKVARKYVVICSFLRVRVLWRAGGSSERGKYYATVHHHSPIKNVYGLGRKSYISHHLCIY